MSEYFNILLLIYAFAIPASLVWFGIYYYLKRKEKKGAVLSVKEEGWMGVSKFSGVFILIIPLISILIAPFDNNAIGILILLIIVLSVIIHSYLRKGKI